MSEGEFGGAALVEAPRLATFSRPSMTESLEMERTQLKERLAKVESALASMKKNPEVAVTIDAIVRLGKLH